MRVLSAFVAIGALAACDGRAPDATASESLAVINGTADSAHESIVSIATTPDASKPELCTGVVVAPRVVLTAGHCTLGQDPSTLAVGIGASASTPSRTVAVSSVLTYPAFTGAFDDVQGGLDLGALILAEDANVAAVPLLRSDASAYVGQKLTLVGFGLSDASDIDSRGSRRVADVSIDSACSALLAFGDASSNACHGDSGGPLLARAADGSESLVAIVSYGDELRCASPSFAVRVDRYAAWIASVVDGSALDAGACAACPPRATDCTAADAALDSPAAPPLDAGAEAASAASPAGGGGGCAVRPRGSSAGGAALFAILLVATARRRRFGV